MGRREPRVRDRVRIPERIAQEHADADGRVETDSGGSGAEPAAVVRRQCERRLQTSRRRGGISTGGGDQEGNRRVMPTPSPLASPLSTGERGWDAIARGTKEIKGTQL